MSENEIVRNVVIRLKTEMLSIGSAFISSMHVDVGPRGEKLGRGEPSGLEQIGNKASIMISPFSLRGWFRHGVESYLMENGISVCHPMNPSSKPSRKNEATGKLFIDEDMEFGYHPQGDCIENGKQGCLVGQMFGALQRPGAFMQKQVITTPVKSKRSLNDGIGAGNYRMMHISPTTRSPLGERAPYRTHETDILAFIDVPWRIKIREYISNEKTRIYIGLMTRTFDWLDAHREDFFHQLGGKRNMGCGIIRASIINPLYGEKELEALLKKKSQDNEEDENIDVSRPHGIGVNEELDKKWLETRVSCERLLDGEIAKQREIFPMPIKVE